MASNPKHFYTPEEYLSLERKATYKSEYCAGEIFAMAGASLAHSRIVMNVGTTLSVQLEDKDCDVYANELRVKTPDNALYTYPDIVVSCGQLKLEDSSFDTLLNPVLIIEVLSPSTEAYDRAKKFAFYRKIESLKEYILVAQDECRVTQYTNQEDGSWVFNESSNLEDTIRLASLPCVLDLQKVYRRIEFTPEVEANSGLTQPSN